MSTENLLLDLGGTNLRVGYGNDKNLKVDSPRVVSHLAFGFLILFIGINYNFSLEKDYLLPVVDLIKTRKRALAAFKSISE